MIYSITQHIISEKYCRAIGRQSNHKTQNSQQLLINRTSKKSTFNMDLCRALISANIPTTKQVTKYSFVNSYNYILKNMCPLNRHLESSISMIITRKL